MKTLNIPSGGTSYTFDNLFKGKLTDRIAIAMVADTAATGSYWANPFSSRAKAISEPLCTLRVHDMLMRSSIVL